MGRGREMTPTRNPWPSLGAGLATGLALGAGVLLFGAGGEEDLRTGVRLTGRTSFFFFLVPLVARPLHILFGSDWTSWLMARRGNFGLAFAGNHLAHLGFIVALYEASPTPPVTEAVRWGGIVGLVLLAAMAVLTFEAPARWIGPRATGIVHRLALHYILWIFFYDIVLKNPLGSYPVLTSLWVAAVALRVVAWRAEVRSVQPGLDPREVQA